MPVMAAHPTPQAIATQAIIETLGNAELTPAELISAVGEQRDLSDAVIRVAIWYLISQNQLELSADQKLRVAHAA